MFSINRLLVCRRDLPVNVCLLDPVNDLQTMIPYPRICRLVDCHTPGEQDEYQKRWQARAQSSRGMEGRCKVIAKSFVWGRKSKMNRASVSGQINYGASRCCRWISSQRSGLVPLWPGVVQVTSPAAARWRATLVPGVRSRPKLARVWSARGGGRGKLKSD